MAASNFTDVCPACEGTGFERVEQQAALDHLTAILTPRERTVIMLRFEHELTQAEIAQQVGVSQMQVSRILRHSLERLRCYLSAGDRHPEAARTSAAVTSPMLVPSGASRCSCSTFACAVTTAVDD